MADWVKQAARVGRFPRVSTLTKPHVRMWPSPPEPSIASACSYQKILGTKCS
jgi:hypothetical protein